MRPQNYYTVLFEYLWGPCFPRLLAKRRNEFASEAHRFSKDLTSAFTWRVLYPNLAMSLLYAVGLYAYVAYDSKIKICYKNKLQATQHIC